MPDRFAPPPLTTPEGDQWGTAAGAGEISAGKYDGPEAKLSFPWKCPKCGVQNEGALKYGCVHCGAGKPGYHVGIATPPSPALSETAVFEAVKADMKRGAETIQDQLAVYPVGEAWAEAHAGASLAEAFVAGYMLARHHHFAHAMQAPPVTADVRTLAPHTKAQRTIIAALEIFKDQILSQGPEEIASGEWMSVVEVDQLIATMQAQL